MNWIASVIIAFVIGWIFGSEWGAKVGYAAALKYYQRQAEQQWAQYKRKERKIGK